MALLKFHWNLFIRACPRYRYDTSQFPHGTSRRGKTIPLFFRPVQEMATVGIMERVDFPWPPMFYEKFLDNSRPGSLGVHSVFLFGIQMKFHSNIPGCSRCSESPPAALHTHHIPASLGFVSVAPSAASRRQSSPGPCRQWSRVVPRKKSRSTVRLGYSKLSVRTSPLPKRRSSNVVANHLMKQSCNRCVSLWIMTIRRHRFDLRVGIRTPAGVPSVRREEQTFAI